LGIPARRPLGLAQGYYSQPFTPFLSSAAIRHSSSVALLGVARCRSAAQPAPGRWLRLWRQPRDSEHGLLEQHRAAAAQLSDTISADNVLAQLIGGAAAGADGLGVDLLKDARKLVDCGNGKKRREYLLLGPLARLFNR
jgi:hypothetical protein